MLVVYRIALGYHLINFWSIKMNTNTNQTSYIEILDSFTSGQGKTHDTESGFRLAELFTISQIDNGNLELFYNGQSANITNQFLFAEFGTLLHKELRDKPKTKQLETLQAFSENRLNLNHRLDGETPRAKNLEPDTHLMSAEQYRSFCLAEKQELKLKYQSAVNLLESSGLLSETLLQQINKKIDNFIVEFSDEQKEIYESKIELEEKAKERQVILEKAGFSRIMPCLGYKDANGKGQKFKGFQADIDLTLDKIVRQTALIEANYIPVYAAAINDKTGVIYFTEFEVSDNLI